MAIRLIFYVFYSILFLEPGISALIWLSSARDNNLVISDLNSMHWLSVYKIQYGIYDESSGKG